MLNRCLSFLICQSSQMKQATAGGVSFCGAAARWHHGSSSAPLEAAPILSWQPFFFFFSFLKYFILSLLWTIGPAEYLESVEVRKEVEWMGNISKWNRGSGPGTIYLYWRKAQCAGDPILGLFAASAARKVKHIFLFKRTFSFTGEAQQKKKECRSNINRPIGLIYGDGMQPGAAQQLFTSPTILIKLYDK